MNRNGTWKAETDKKRGVEEQPCPQCGLAIGVVAGSHDAVCKNCGFKDPCCE